MKVTIQDSRTSVTVEPRDFRVTVSGARGPAGIGIAAGGAEGQILAKATATDYDTEWIDNYAINVEVYVKNSSGSPMTKGQVVYISGADGTNPTISLAIATTEMGSSKTIGWLKQDLADGAFGYVITEGLLEGINTNGAGAAGDPIWLSPTTAGGVVYGIANKPSAPNHLVFLGYVLRKQTNNGKVYVKIQNGFELGELHDVYNGAKTTPIGNDALLLRDSADSNLWKRLTWTNALAGVKSHMDTFKSVANGYASLDGSGKVPASELPSYVDDVVEVANYAALPGTGETGKIYVTLDTNKCYRWSGSVYIQVSQGVDTLTTTGTSGPATLVGSTLNIPQYQAALTNPVTGTGTAGQVAYFNGTSAVTGSANLFWDNTNGRLGIGLNTSLTARAHIRGSGTTSATTALLVQNSTPSELFKITDDGTVTVANNNIVTNGILAVSGTMAIRSNLAAISGNYTVLDNNNVTITTTSSTTSSVRIINTYAPTSGTGIFNRLAIEGIINQTGGANGITRGLYVNPTLTAAADWRSVEFSNNTGWGIYGGGSAPSYYAGAVAIGTTGVDGTSAYSLRVSRQFTTVATARGIVSDAQITAGPLNVLYFGTAASATATASVTQLRHFYAAQGTFTAGSVITNQYGFSVSDALVGATFNYAFQGSIPSAANRWNLYMDGTAANYLAGNTSIGTTTSSGRLTVQGSGTTSATTSFLVQNSTPTELFQITDNGFVRFRSSLITFSGVTTPFTILHRGDITDGVLFGQNSDTTITSGNRNTFSITESFIPTSGTATLSVQRIAPSINQTGGANGITRGLYVNPTLTAAADWRSIEFSNSTGWGIYGAGTANNYLAGSLGIGATGLTQYSLRIGKNITGGVNAFGVGVVATVQSDVTSSANVYYSTVGTAASSFTLGLLRHFHVDEASFGLGSSVTNQRGFSVGAMSGATNNYGFYGDIASGTGRWNLYMNGTAANYLAGNLGIGTASPSLALQVERSSNGSESIWLRNTNTGASAFGAVVAASYGVSPSTTGTIELRSHNFNHGAWPSTGMLIANSSLTNGLAIFATAGNITFNTTVSGTERARIESGGNFLIGTTTSSGRLTVRGSGTTSASNGLLVEDSGGTDTFTIRDDGGFAFKGGTVGVAQTGYTTFTNLTTDRTCNANATTVEELADILGTLIEDLKTKGIISA